ncbi:PAS domain S-box protein [Neptunicella sp. SCSIO 80796]|uniref:PAS domain S-box protein n=1 Tax=Neptunicella plasticusilytica TaxID=3117012 RepID=UPI003A4E40FC
MELKLSAPDQSKNKTRHQYPLLFPFMILLFGTLLGVWMQEQDKYKNNLIIQQSLQSRLDDIGEQIVEKVTLYQYGLRGLRGSISSQGIDNYHYQQMLNYTKSRDYAHEFPGARGFGFIRRIKQDEQSRFVAEMQQERDVSFKIRQLNAHNDDLFVIQYIEPEIRNKEAVGLDIGSEITRRTAALLAAEQNTLALTGPITLVQDEQQTKHGFLLLLPVYKSSSSPPPDLRLEQLVGWSYTPLLIGEILNSITQINDKLSLTIADVSADDNRITFFDRPSKSPELSQYKVALTQPLYGRQWQIELTASQAFIDSLTLLPANDKLRLSILLSVLLAIIAFFIQINFYRRRLLTRHKAELAAIVTNANEVIIGKDKEGIITSWNGAAEQMFGYAESEAIGMKVMDLIVPPDKIDEEDYIVSKIIKDEKIRSLDTIRKTRKGKRIPVSVNVTPIKDESHNVIGSAVTILDISHIKEAEQNLLRANEELEHKVTLRTNEIAQVSAFQRSIFESAEYAIIATDQQGLITLFNPAAENILQYRKDELVGKQTPAIFHDAEEIKQRAQILSAELNTTIEPGFEVFVAKARQGHIDNNEWSYIRKDGSVCPVNLSVSSLTNDKGELIGFLGIAIDLTRQKQLEFELSLTKLSTEQTSDAVFWLTPESRIIKVNQAAHHTLGYGQEELLNIEIEQFCPEYNADEWKTKLERLNQLQLDSYFISKDGDKVPVSLTSTLVNLSEQQFIYVVARNISERIHREHELAVAKDEADAANKAKSAFLANMSHEIRTPMNAIIGLLQLVQQTELSAKQLEYIEKARTASTSLLNLLNDILDFSKVEADKLMLEEHCFDLHQLMSEISSILSISLADKDIEVIYDIPTRSPFLLNGDGFRLKQVLLNLASNAIKFTEKGEVVISIKQVQQTDDAVQLMFDIKDTGIGMSSNQIQQLFSSFSQAETSTSRRYGGTGLGLAISKRLVELMGGKISVESQPDIGSTFSFSLWLTKENNNDVSVTDAIDVDNLHVLIVDDNEHARAILAQMLSEIGWKVDNASSGLDALNKIQNKQKINAFYDLIFMDWKMPGMDGWQTAEQIREILPSNQASLIVMITAYSRDMLANKHMADSDLFNGFLEKPVTKTMVLNTIKDAYSQATRESVSIPEKTSNRLSGLELLLVEDNPTNQLVASELLALEGAKVIIAQGGTYALQELKDRTDPFDLILMDIQMPDLDGYQTTQRIRKMPIMQDTPIVAMTANAMQSDKDACFAAGMNDHVGKPFEIDHLVDVILNNLQQNKINPVPQKTQSNQVLSEEALHYCQQANINVLDAFQRMRNSKSLYSKILQSFDNELKDYQEQIASNQLTTDTEYTKRLFHSLKGTAATVGFSEMIDFSTRQDKLLQDEQYSLTSEVIGEFSVLITQAIEKINQLQKYLD